MPVAVQTVSSDLNYFTPPVDGSKPYTYINFDPITKKTDRNWEFSIFSKNIENVRGKEG
jgi:hypothetical protein